ncbi:MAG: cytochrome c oxidase accessory protein CcoG [Betaproteobacteria bacterium HGW-Betaproteobacteria-11]|nr:MAG: cytochrome c oxidase accessory protein CcoG [Betaproteobacteria bacterium HGW-Betaproteobacteria-11]
MLITMAATPPQQTESPAFAEQSLYEVQQKVYPRAVTGTFAQWRWSMAWLTQVLYYGLCWLPWNGRQAVLFDLAERKFYIFGLVFWPQDVIFLAVLLIISAYSLFLFTAVGGRLWCGYACPQTVYTEIFLWIERKIEGDRSARMKLDAAVMSRRKFFLRVAKHGAWGLLALWTGFTFVGYFTPIKTLWTSAWSFSLGPWEAFWIFFYGGFTYLFAGHLREQVCKHMCPYARFQGVMFDPDTLTVTYDVTRGEPRGARKKGIDYRAAGLGDCVDCSICVQVCPTGIDIRNGLQYECIGCAACIDGCDQVMEKMGYPKGLIRYSTERAIESHWGWKEIIAHVLRPRVLLYSAILWAIIIAFVWGLATRLPLRVDVIRDRAILAREVEGGLMENVYRLHVMNVSEAAHRYAVSVSGLPGIDMEGDHIVEVPPAVDKVFTIQVRVPPDNGKKGANVIYFDVKSLADERVAVHEKATFLLP